MNVKEIENIYFNFRKAQSEFNNRGFRLPKDFESYFNSKFREPNKKALIKITGRFLTKWQDIDPYIYFKCGFDLYKNKFTYTKFFKEEILRLYIQRDKNRKREIEITKKGLVDSAIFVKKWCKNNNSCLYDYMRIRNENKLVVIDHYLKNKIDASFFVFLLRKGMILTDNDRSLIPYIHTNYRRINFGLNDLKLFLKKMEEKLI